MTHRLEIHLQYVIASDGFDRISLQCLIGSLFVKVPVYGGDKAHSDDLAGFIFNGDFSK